MSVTIDNLAKMLPIPTRARHSAQLYHESRRHRRQPLDANISLKLTHMGLDVDEKLAREIVRGLVAKAASIGPLPASCASTWRASLHAAHARFVHELQRMPENAKSVGTVIHTTCDDPRVMLKNSLPKGSASASAKEHTKNRRRLPFPAKSDVDANYVKLMKILMKSGIYHGLATPTRRSFNKPRHSRQRKTFPRLVRISNALRHPPRLQRKLVRDGWRLRIYIPFGTEWYPSSCGGWASGRPT